MNEYVIVPFEGLPEDVRKDLLPLTIRFGEDDIWSFSQCTTNKNKFKFDIPVMYNGNCEVATLYADVEDFIVQVFIDDMEISLKELMFMYAEAKEI